jgi:hypothetical protein
MFPKISPAEFDRRRRSAKSPPPSANGMEADPVPLIRGSRNGKIVDMAGRFLISLSSHSSCFPIFTSEYAGPTGELNAAGTALLEGVYHGITTDKPSSRDDDERTVQVDVRNVRPRSLHHYQVREEIVDNIGQALVFLIGIKLPHALIVIRTLDGRNYSCGYGYYGDISPDETPKLSKFHSFASKIFSTKTSHKVEPLRGAIYTADYMTPDSTHEAKVIWVGLLTRGIVDRLNATLSTGQQLVIKVKPQDISSTFKCRGCEVLTVGHKKDGCMSCKSGDLRRRSREGNIISILEMRLTVANIYLEASAFVGGEYYNCIEWAKGILGIPYLNCGLLGNPNSCLNVTETEIGSIIEAFERDNSDDLQEIIDSVQTRLSKKGIVRLTAECLGCAGTGGRRRRKINKKYTKRSRLHSRRRRSIKKKSNKINRI